MTILELREKRNKTWEAAKAFLDTHRSEKGTLSAEDDATYTKMEQDIEDYGREIARLERQAALDAELAKPVGEPIKNTPSGAKPEKTGRASDEYKKQFWNVLKSKNPVHEVVNALQIGTDSEGGYLVPDEFERTLVQGLEDANIIRQLAKVINTDSGERKIPVVASHGSAAWIAEESALTESDDVFGQVTLGAHKLGTLIKVSNELLSDSVFDLESYMASEFARRIGNAEEDAFINGNGTNKPTGIITSASAGVTTAAASAITLDEIIDLYHSLKTPYRKNASFIMNDATIKVIRKMKDENGQYLWQPSVRDGEPDTLLGRPIYASSYMPTIAASNVPIIFGDYSYYWIADRQGRVFKRLNELYAGNDQTGFLATQRVDGKLTLEEAVKKLTMKAS
ncbi:MAG: phage major capsid protein [Firmicutes bacterium]|nr:phage major capsid protein [Bacillota bacterium]